MNIRKTLRRRVLTLLLAVALVFSALMVVSATEYYADIQLNGVKVPFDAKSTPVNRNGRVFVPYRVLFEALGAEVDWEADTRTAIAVRGDKTIRVPIDGKEIFIYEKGRLVEVFKMKDAACLVGNRTFVPVRFMAQAMDCMVGWDQEDQTVVLVDHYAAAEKAAAGQSYILMEAGQAMLDKVIPGDNLALSGELYQVIEAKGITIAYTTGSYTGLSAAGVGSQVTLHMESDYSAGYKAEARAQGITLQELLKKMGILEEELYATVTLEMRVDEVNGNYWMLVTEATGSMAYLPQNIWMDVGGETELYGMEVTSLMSMEKSMDPVELVVQALETLDISDDDTAMGNVTRLANLVAGNLCDSAFSNGLTQTARWSVNDVAYSVTIEQNENWDVIRCAWESSATEGDRVATSHAELDVQGNMTETVTVTAEGQTTTVTQTGRYAVTNKLPEVTAPVQEQE